MPCRVKCWAFSPPGGLADRNVSRAAQEFCTSVFLGKDWIPRLTVNSFERLRDEMVGLCLLLRICSTVDCHEADWAKYALLAVESF